MITFMLESTPSHLQFHFCRQRWLNLELYMLGARLGQLLVCPEICHGVYVYTIWFMIWYDIWYMIYDIWYMIYDIWYDICYMIYDIWYMMWCGMIWCNVIWYGMIWYVKMEYDLAQCSVESYYMIWYDELLQWASNLGTHLWNDMTWYDSKTHNVLYVHIHAHNILTCIYIRNNSWDE